MIAFSGTSKLAIQAAYSQQNCGGGTANSDAFVVSAMQSRNPAKFRENLRDVNLVDRMNSSGTANENVICLDKLWLNFKSAFLN